MREPRTFRLPALGSVAAGMLLFTWIGLVVGTPAHAQTTPDIRGSYVIQGTSTATCSPGGSGTGSGTAVLTIPFQNQQSFSGSVTQPQQQMSIPIFVMGQVDQAGNLTGTYGFSADFNPVTINASGTFTGQVTADQIQFNLVGTEQISGDGTTINCDETISISGSRTSTTTGPKADISITQTASQAQAAAGQVASGTQITYTMVVKNLGPDDATGVLVEDEIPAGTTLTSAKTSQGLVQGLTPGATGNITCMVGNLANGASATVSLTVNVLAPGGSTLVNSPFAASDLFDATIRNNATSLSNAVVGGAILRLVWDQPPPTAADPTPAPQNLRIVVVAPAIVDADVRRLTPQDSCALVDVNVYKSDHPNVQTIPANLWETVPPDMLQTTMAAAPVGSFYVITNVWNCGGTVVESGPSNEASVPAGPTITKLKVAAKLKAFGSGFSGPVQVLVNGVGFIKKAVVQGGTTIVQKGTLTDGTPIGNIGATGSVLVTIVNANGGIGTFTFKKP